MKIFALKSVLCYPDKYRNCQQLKFTVIRFVHLEIN